MALGKAIVAFDLTEHKVTAGDAALYAKPNEELDLARKIETLMDDSHLRLRMGMIGRERVEQKLDWALQLHHLIEAYQQLTREKAAASFTAVNRPGAQPKD
jgi:glycosyltransferase involved in cell wall biosynthesis